MKRINLAKYGFERCPEEDFSDDGNRFICYKHPEAPNLRVSKLVADGDVYLSTSWVKTELEYDEYKEIKAYEISSWKYNGVKLESLTEEDLEIFKLACIEASKKYDELANKVKYPTYEEFEAIFNKENDQARKDLEEANQFYDNELKSIFGKYDLKSYYFKTILEDISDAFKSLNRTLNRNKKETIDYWMKGSRQSQLYTVRRDITSNYDLKRAKKYYAELIND